MTPLDFEQRKAAIETFLEKYRKKVDASLLKRLVENPSCAVPLYLRLLLEELRLHASHERLHSWADELLKEKEAGDLFLKVLAGIDRDLKEEGLRDLGSRGARLMAASRRGLRRRDLAVLLDKDHSRSRLPDRLLSPVLARLEPFCLNDNGRLYIMHGLLRSRLLEGEESARIRKELIDYPFEDENERLAERLYQWDALENNKGLGEILGDLDQIMRLWVYDPKLLEAVLYAQGAGQNCFVNPLMVQVSQGWKNYLTDRKEDLPRGIDQLENWLHKKFFLGILEPLLEGVLEWRRRHLTPDRLDLASSLAKLGHLYYVQERVGESELLHKEALEIRKAALPIGDPAIVASLESLGTLYLRQRLFMKAEPLLKEALAICKSSVSSVHPAIAASLETLGNLYLSQKRLMKAEPLLKEALAIRKSFIFKEKADIIYSLNSLARLRQAQGRIRKSESLLKEAVTLGKSSLHPEHPYIALSLYNLASLYLANWRLEEARPLYEEALKIRMDILPAGHQSRCC